MSREIATVLAHVRRFPRVSGDEPPLWGGLYYLEEFSPRERG